VFDVRWLMSSYSAIHAIWRDLAPLQSHMACLSTDGATAAKDRAKFVGLHRKLQTWKVVAELGHCTSYRGSACTCSTEILPY